MVSEAPLVKLTSNENITSKPGLQPTCKLYKRRWLIIILFVLYSTSNMIQWNQYTIIADIIVDYYEVSYTAANWSSLIFLVLYILLSFPGSYLLDKIDLRHAVLLGTVGTCVGAWIKVASVSPDRFWVIILGQIFVAICGVLVLPLPPKLAALWFGPNEVSLACGIGVLSSEIGFAAGFLAPPLFMQNQHPQIGLFNMSFSVAVFASFVTILLVVFFQAAPPSSPSFAQLQIAEKTKEGTNFPQSLKNIMLNPSYVLLLIAFGLYMGIYFAVTILLNQIVQKYHPEAAADAGIIGLAMIFSGIVGGIICGVLLDRFKRYKEAMLIAYAITLIAMIAHIFAVSQRIEFVYLAMILFGFPMTGVTTIGFELGVELTYPEPESTSGGLLTACSQLFGIIFTYLYTFLFNDVGDVWANVTMCAILVLSIILIICIRCDLRRQAAETKSL